MAGPLFYDRVKERTIVTGTGTMTLLGALTGFQTFVVVGNTNTCYYAIYAVDASGRPTGDWEVGFGTYTLSGTTLSRTTVLASSNSGSAVSFAAGDKHVILTNPAANHLVVDTDGTLAANSDSKVATQKAVKTAIAAVSGASLADGDYGDVTVSGGGTVITIDAGAVTYAKMQDVSNTSLILGRKTAGGGDVEECTISEILDFVTGAAQGAILFRGASGWDQLTPSTDTYVLTTHGASADPTWEAPGGSGGVAGSDTQFQFNNSSAMAGATYATYITGSETSIFKNLVTSTLYIFDLGTTFPANVPTGGFAGVFQVSDGLSNNRAVLFDLNDGDRSITFHGDLIVASGGASVKGIIESGVYTPSVTVDTNLDSASPSGDFFWMRIGDIVHVSGQLSVDATGPGLCQATVSLPISSAFASYLDVVGSVVTFDFTDGYVGGDATHHTAVLDFMMVTTTGTSVWVQFMYRIF